MAVPPQINEADIVWPRSGTDSVRQTQGVCVGQCRMRLVAQRPLAFGDIASMVLVHMRLLVGIPSVR